MLSWQVYVISSCGAVELNIEFVRRPNLAHLKMIWLHRGKKECLWKKCTAWSKDIYGRFLEKNRINLA